MLESTVPAGARTPAAPAAPAADEGARPADEAGADLFGIARSVHTHRDSRGGLLSITGRRRYGFPIAKVWSALTEPERLKYWFHPVTGELRPGGEFQAHGNAAGEIRRCDAPTLLRFTWGDDSSVVEIRLAADAAADASVVELVHTVPIEMAGNGTGAFYVGPGWDFALHALDAYLRATPPIAPGSVAEQAFNRKSLLAWALAVEASGTATPDEVVAAVEATLPQWAPDLGPA